MYDLLICNGALPDIPRCGALAQGAHVIVCADGGADKARACGIDPHIVIGDFDSISVDTLHYNRERGAEVIHLTRQDDTDFEKALKLLGERGCASLVVLGLTGGLLDHTLGNLSILARHVGEMEITVFDPDYRIDVITKPRSFRAAAGSRVSIVPLKPATGVHYTGLEYRLPFGTLKFGMNEGTCNRAIDPEFSVALESGALLVFRELTEEMLEV